MISTSDFKKGVTVKINNEPFVIIEFQHVKPGKGNAFVRTKLKNILHGSLLERTFKSGEVFPEADVSLVDYNFLYNDGEAYHFMHKTNYEQIELNASVIDKKVKYLKENMKVKIQFYEEKPVAVELPNFVDLLVTYCEPGVKGDSATTSSKPATLETGTDVSVPLHIKMEDIIRIDTRTGKYVEKVK
jgi:elongation factor P